MRAAPQKESRLETEEELGGEVREVIRRDEWVRRRMARMDHAAAGKGLLRRRSLVGSLSSRSRSNKAKTDVEMRSPKGRKGGEGRGGRQAD